MKLTFPPTKLFLLIALLALSAGASWAQQNPQVWWPDSRYWNDFTKCEIFEVDWDYSGPRPDYFVIGLSDNGGASYNYTLASRISPTARSWRGRINSYRPDFPCSNSLNKRVRVNAVFASGWRFGSGNPGGGFRVRCCSNFSMPNGADAADSRDQVYTLDEVQVETAAPQPTASAVLEQNSPNPFNPSTQISFSLPEAGAVKLEIFNSLGQSLQTLVDETRAAGHYSVTFDATALPSGVYLCRLTAGRQVEMKKMLLTK
jgi:hypothetical protein